MSQHVKATSPRSWLSWLSGKTRTQRLQAAVTRREHLLKIRRDAASDDTRRRAVTSAQTLLKEAGEQTDLNTAWTLVLDADRAALAGLADDELREYAGTLREEITEKLTGWRRAAALRALGDPATPPSVAGVQEAQGTINEHFLNQYYRFDFLASQVVVIGALLSVSLAVLFVASWRNVKPLGDYTTVVGWSMLLGALGGALSTARGLTAGSKDRKIPEQLSDTVVTVMRPVIGASAGVAAAMFVVAGVASIGTKDAAFAPLCVAFAAGFSESYFLSLIPTGGK